MFAAVNSYLDGLGNMYYEDWNINSPFNAGLQGAGLSPQWAGNIENGLNWVGAASSLKDAASLSSRVLPKLGERALPASIPRITPSLRPSNIMKPPIRNTPRPSSLPRGNGVGGSKPSGGYRGNRVSGYGRR